jgi:hypothetical protein
MQEPPLFSEDKALVYYPRGLSFWVFIKINYHAGQTYLLSGLLLQLVGYTIDCDFHSYFVPDKKQSMSCLGLLHIQESVSCAKN